ncbi:MAG: GNAT family N-acetyltransferase [Fidelibacterota bacterium]
MKYSICHLANAVHVIPTLSQWLLDQWGYLHVNDSIDRRRAILHSHLNRENIPFSFVALDGDDPLGSASVVERDIPGRPDLSPCVASVYVHRPYRQQGVGSALMKAVTAHAHGLGYDKLYLFTWDQEKLYAALGWETVGRSTYRGEPIVIMGWESKAVSN